MKPGLTMMVLVAIASFPVAGIVPAPAYALTGDINVITIRGKENVRVTGEVVSATRDKLTINTGTNTIDVDMRSLAQRAQISALIRPGMRVSVMGALGSGTFNMPVVTAREIAIIDSAD